MFPFRRILKFLSGPTVRSATFIALSILSLQPVLGASDPRLLDFVDSFRADPYGFRHSFFKGKEPAYSLPDSNSLLVEYKGISNKVEVTYTILYSGDHILAYNLSIRAETKELDSVLYALYLATPNSMYYKEPGWIGISNYDETVFLNFKEASFRGSVLKDYPDSINHAILYLCSYFSGLEFGRGGTIGAHDLKNYEITENMYRYIPAGQYHLLLHAANPVTQVNAALVYLNNRSQFPKTVRKQLDDRVKQMKNSHEHVKIHFAGCKRPPPRDISVRSILKNHKSFP